MKFRALPAAAMLLVLAGCAAAAAPTEDTSSLAATAPLRRAVTVDGVFRHLEAFQAIADRNGGNRAAGSPGYDRSAAYVAERLRAAGYAVEFQAFDFPYFEETRPPVLAVVETSGTQPSIGAVHSLVYSGSGDIEAPLRPVDLGMVPGTSPSRSTSGCEAADFAGFPSGAIALVRRGTCRFEAKVDNATAAGAAGIVILNSGVGDAVGAFHGQLAEPAEIPAVAIGYAAGERLLAATRAGAVTVHLSVWVHSGRRVTHNVIAEMPQGDPHHVVLVGAHLDSVPAGPGLNDNGSGAAVILEIALRLAELGTVPRDRIRFAFWGAEEVGLVGSRHYVDALSAKEREKILGVLNFDMLGSPNYGRFVYDGDGSDTEPPDTEPHRRGPHGSAAIERIFLDYFDAVGLAVASTSMHAGSDHAPFAAAGIATGGLYAGSGERKTDAEAALFGGTAGQPYDRCYHRACDRVGSVNRQAIDELSDAAAHAILTLASKSAAGA